MHRTLLGVLIAAGLTGLTDVPDARADDAAWYIGGSFTFDDVDLSLSYRHGAHRDRDYWFVAPGDFHVHARYGCGSHCEPYGRGHVRHHHRCPRLGHFLGGYGYAPGDLIRHHRYRAHQGPSYRPHHRGHRGDHPGYRGRGHRKHGCRY